MRRSHLVAFALFVACSSAPVAPQLPSVGAWQYIPEGSGEPDLQGPQWAWTGSKLFALGAANALQSESDVTLLDPGTGVWTPSTAVGAPSPRQYGFFVWTGTEVFVWSGLCYRTDLADGGLYDPAADSWRPLPAAPISPRHLGTTVWTGAVVIVWGGMSLDSASNDVYFNDGAKFDPGSGSWSPLAISGAPSPRSWSSAVWTGTQMLVWGGQDASGQLGDGAAYDPVADTWTPISGVGAPSPREAHGSVWSGTEMIVVAGECVGYFCRDGGSYDPAKDSWRLFSIPAPDGYIAGNSAAWTGSKLLTWGSVPSGSGWGGIYDPSTNSWAEMASAPSQLAGRVPDVVVWTGSSAIIYGGQFNGLYFGDGALFTP